ncbi:phage holin family protein [Cohnella nanjingensis]|uniref:Phage holin family protein n=2 Tax=Cohnella nanjingensis TaxID=1387779 RepID=A0A7X0VH78_9BACL|nr:phage holin family protein [Cohnella nanjingensis]MBB6673855.1 phage holin family protein [Cohnella nanjingensis]
MFAYGHWPETLTVLLIVMALDYLTGVTAAVREGSGLSSQVGFWGLWRKGLMLLVILLAHRIDILFGTEMAMGGAIYFYLANELLSVLENAGRIGLPIPDRLRRAVKILRDRADDEDRRPPGRS